MILFTDWSRLPAELRPRVRKRKKVKTTIKPNIPTTLQKVKPEDILEVSLINMNTKHAVSTGPLVRGHLI